MNKRYIDRIDRVLKYIDANLHQNICLDEVASISHFSKYHFHRIFSGFMQETLNDYIVRRRLENAVNTLIFEADLTITDVALRHGFSSSANFSKAVKQYFGYSPSEIRTAKQSHNSKIGKIVSKYGKDFKPRDLYPLRNSNNVIHHKRLEDINMNVEIRELEEQAVCTLSSTNGYQLESLYETWDKVTNWANGHGITEQSRFAFCYDNPAVTPENKCRYDASVVIDSKVDVNLPFKKSVIPRGKYAVLYFKGQSGETDTQLSLYTDWLPNSGFEPDNFPMLERYLNDAREDGYVEMEIYIKLKNLV